MKMETAFDRNMYHEDGDGSLYLMRPLITGLPPFEPPIFLWYRLIFAKESTSVKFGILMSALSPDAVSNDLIWE